MAPSGRYDGPSVRGATSKHAPVAQLDRASVYGTEGREFESLRARYVKASKMEAFLLPAEGDGGFCLRFCTGCPTPPAATRGRDPLPPKLQPIRLLCNEVSVGRPDCACGRHRTGPENATKVG